MNCCRTRGKCAIAFAAGIITSCLLPEGCFTFIVVVLLIILGCCLIRK
ncbi:MAG: hypothetical protein ACI4F2_01375 [Acutalibacteraceae bacterium]